MKKMISVIICGLFVCTLGLAACGNNNTSAPASTPPEGSSSAEPVIQGSAAAEPEGEVPSGPVVGGWVVNDLIEPVLDETERETFAKAKEGFVGSNLDAVTVLATQVVAGSNLAYLCLETPVVPDAQSEWSIVVVYHDLQDNDEITHVATIDLGDVKVAEAKDTSNIVGGWTVKDTGGIPATLPIKELEAAFEKLASEYTDVQLGAIELLGTQLVSGTNYKILCKGTHDGQTDLYVVVLYMDLEGNAEFTSVELFDLLAYVSD